MQLTHLPPGEHAAPDADRIAITMLPDGRFGYAGTVGRGAARAGLVGPNRFRTEADALAAACAWSAAQGVDQLLVEHGKL